MKADEIPEFLFRGAVVSVDGRQQVVSQLSLERPVHKGIPGPHDVLYLKFKSGLELEYQKDRVREIPGKPPEFIYQGAKIFCKYPPESKVPGKSFSTAVNGVWEVSSFNFRADKKLSVVLKRPTGGKSHMFLSRTFNSKAMFPVNADAEVPKMTPAYQLEKDTRVRKVPVRFKPKDN
ncbi:MAG: hypothetical protein PW788_09360 [Micavibrio sp.]|nr:hypothetical protein [Micavibrio sp.]